jgi:putative hydrolase of the HAD superfamily
VTIEPRAVIFDLDDTLYRERRFALSGFRAVARSISASSDVDAETVCALLVQCFKQGNRASAFQTLCRTFGWPVEMIPDLVDIFRRHTPSLNLPRSSGRTLARLRDGWSVGIVTNGCPDVQRRKVAALGLESLVDVIVYACEQGTGAGKPEAAPFLFAAERLGVEPRRCVFVGDDPIRDVYGAQAVGMRAIGIDRSAHDRSTTAVHQDADAVTHTIENVPRLAAALVTITERDAKCA